MPALSRVGDVNQTGGQIVRGADSVFANGIAVGLHVSQITNHGPYGKRTGQHRGPITTDGSPTVFAEGCPVLRVGSGNSCGHSIVQGSPDISVP